MKFVLSIATDTKMFCYSCLTKVLSTKKQQLLMQMIILSANILAIKRIQTLCILVCQGAPIVRKQVRLFHIGALCVALCMVVSLAAPAFAATETFVKTNNYRCSKADDCGVFNLWHQKYDEYKSTTTGNLLYQHAGYGVCC